MLILLVLVIAALILIAVLFRRMNKFKKHILASKHICQKTNFEDLLQANLGELKNVKQKIQIQETKIDRMETKLRSAVDNAALVRFNSFAHMGAELSFALALLDQEGTGVLITAIQSIEECRIYAKVIEKGKAGVKLSEEEKQAIEKACSGAKKI
jgi:3-dehydroquinate synthase class II